MTRLFQNLLIAAAMAGFASGTEPANIEPLFATDKLQFSYREGLSEAERDAFLDDIESLGIVPNERFDSVEGGVLLLPGSLGLGRAFQLLQVRPETGTLHVYPKILILALGPPFILERPFNFSARARVGTGESVTIGGIVMRGVPQLTAFRVRGASLAEYGIQDPLPDPHLTLHDRHGEVLLSNDDWSELAEWEQMLFLRLDKAPLSDKDAVIVSYLDPGNYTAVVRGAAGEEGVALLEVYHLEELLVSGGSAGQ